MIDQKAFSLERRRLQRRSVRYALLSLMLTAILLITTGCALTLGGREKEAYDCIIHSNVLDDAKSVKMLGGRMYGGDLYGHFAYKTRGGSYEFELLRISPGGYTRFITITIYTLDESERCLAEGYLDLDALNSALEFHYESPLGGIGGLAINLFDGGDHMFLTIIILIVVLCLHGLLSSKASDIAQDKGYEKSTWFHMCFWLGPLSFIIVAAMPDRVLRKKQDETNEQLRQLLEYATKSKTDSLLTQLIECSQAAPAAAPVQSVFYPAAAPAPTAEPTAYHAPSSRRRSVQSNPQE